jgi:hypothetical protein
LGQEEHPDVAISVVKSTNSSSSSATAATATSATASATPTATAAAAGSASATADTVLATAAVQYKGPGDSPPGDAPAVDEGGTELIRLRVRVVSVSCHFKHSAYSLVLV